MRVASLKENPSYFHGDPLGINSNNPWVRRILVFSITQDSREAQHVNLFIFTSPPFFFFANSPEVSRGQESVLLIFVTLAIDPE